MNQFLFIFFAHIFIFFLWVANERVKYCKTVPVINPKCHVTVQSLGSSYPCGFYGPPMFENLDENVAVFFSSVLKDKSHELRMCGPKLKT